MRIAILPLDERPVNTRLPEMVAAIAGAEAVLPPDDLLPWMREPGDADALACWLESVADSSDALVVSLDMLGYGGLIPSRTSADGLDAVVHRLGGLERIRAAHPDLRISGVTTVLRASNSYNAGEEPAYWSRYGVELHRLGGALHRRFEAGTGEPDDPEELTRLTAAVPADVRQDFLRRRLRNHTADLYAVGLAATGVLRPLMVTADDTAERSAGSLEQRWLSAWIRALELDAGGADPGGSAALCYPGADEVGATLTAAALADRLPTPPRIAMLFGDERGAGRVAPYENVPVADTVRNQILAAGAIPVDDPDQADAVLLVHPPAGDEDSADRSDPSTRSDGSDRPDGSDGSRASDGSDPSAGSGDRARETLLSRLARQPDRAILGLADVWQPNGADPALVDGLVRHQLVDRLSAYGGWNTAGNTIGSVVAALVAAVAGRALGTYDPVAERRLLLHRLVEDYGYQALVRPELGLRPEFAGFVSSPFDDPADLVSYLAECVPQLESVLTRFDRGWRIGNEQLPWNRTFEIDFTLTPP